jgi:uncharacterized protein YjbJ (UPF0337 family)
MVWNRIQGNWKRYRGALLVKWGQCLHSDSQVMRGKRQELLGQIQARYGVRGTAVEVQVDQFLHALCPTVLEHEKTSTARHEPERRADKP